jgi:aryl-alcohol dehydrogenase-like predicted oxidoreductase
MLHTLFIRKGVFSCAVSLLFQSTVGVETFVKQLRHVDINDIPDYSSYSMMARWHESLFPVLEELNVGYVAFSPMANGLLSGKYDQSSTFEKGTDYRSVMPQFTPEGLEKNRALLKLVNDLAREKEATPAQIALAWMLCKKPYIVPIPGTRKPERLRENAGAADFLLSAEDVSQIDAALDNMEMSAVYRLLCRGGKQRCGRRILRQRPHGR